MRRVIATVLALGFLLGMRHATDPDHVVAVSTIVTRQRTLRDGVRMGAAWGLGHTVTIILVGGAIVTFRLVIPPALELTMEMTVGLMLIVLGVWNITSVVQRAREALGVLRPLVVGLVHGLAGSAGVALLVLTTIGDARWALAYLVLFGVGTIVGMMLITLVIAAPVMAASRRLANVAGHLRVASGLLSLGFGLVLVYRIGFVSGLLAP
jgi:high-affinity nickel-transport protein